MYTIATINNIAKVGTDQFGDSYTLTEDPSHAHALLVRSAKLHDMEFGPELLAIGRAGAGVNNIPLERCAEAGIVVFNTPGANANSVKEAVIAGMLLASRDYMGGVKWVRDNADDPDIAKDAEKAKKDFAGGELAGKTVGVIGLGAIGAMVANSCRQLGCKVLGYDPYLSITGAWGLDRHIAHVTELDQILSQSDFITIHVPASDKTRHMIGEQEIAKMKDGAVLINFARDSLVDETALSKALASKHLGAYVTDFANPISASMKGAIVFPHLGASTEEAEDRCAIMAVREIIDYIENGNIVNSVNFGRVDLGPIQTPARLSVFHKNVPAMIGQITSVVSDSGANIENMANKSTGENAYTLIEMGSAASADLLEKVQSIEGVIRARIIGQTA